MLQFFRNFFKSKVGIVVTLGFLALIGVAFALSDVANNSSFGGVAGGDRVALIGERRIDSSDLVQNAANAIDGLRQQDPTITYESYIASNGLDELLLTMISRHAIAEFGHVSGMRVGRELVDSEIINEPAFRSLDGSFDTQTFRDALRQRGWSEELVRDDFSMGLYAQQLLTPISRSPQMPMSIAATYAAMLQEQRSGTIAAIQAVHFVPEDDPSEEQLAAFYEENTADFLRPERRVFRYATFGEEALGELSAPTEAEIAARYALDIAEYEERQTRRLTQLVAPTQAAAQAIVEEVAGGMSLSRSAQEKGLATVPIAEITQDDLASQTSAAVAASVFAATEGSVAAPAQGDLGWYVMRVDAVDRRAGRSIAQVSAEISTALAAEQRRLMLSELTTQIEDDFAGGNSLSEVAEELGLELQTTEPMTATGQIYGEQAFGPDVLAPVISYAFELEEGNRELAEVIPGQMFLVFDVASITRSAAAPLDEIREDVVSAWSLDEGMKAAEEAARRVIVLVEEGSTMAQAIAAEEADLPRPDTITLSREEISQQGQVPPALALFFSMASDTVKPLESPDIYGWFVIQLDEISTPEMQADDPQIINTQTQLSNLFSQELSSQFVSAVEDAVEIEVNQPAVDAVVLTLTGQAN